MFAHTARVNGADVTARTTCGVHTFGVCGTVLAQAVRAHSLAPRGVGAWVSCTAVHGAPPDPATRLLLGQLATVG